jgi:hypothetical protein
VISSPSPPPAPVKATTLPSDVGSPGMGEPDQRVRDAVARAGGGERDEGMTRRRRERRGRTWRQLESEAQLRTFRIHGLQEERWQQCAWEPGLRNNGTAISGESDLARPSGLLGAARTPSTVVIHAGGVPVR